MPVQPVGVNQAAQGQQPVEQVRRAAPAGVGANQGTIQGRGICKTTTNYISWLVTGSYNLVKRVVCCFLTRESKDIRKVRSEIRSLNTLSADALKAKVQQYNLISTIGEFEWKKGRRVAVLRGIIPGLPFVNTYNTLGDKAVKQNPRIAIPYIRSALDARIRSLKAQERAPK